MNTDYSTETLKFVTIFQNDKKHGNKSGKTCLYIIGI